MENDSDNRIKKWLRAYARQRREQGGREMELPETTRRMLLDEVKRVWGEVAEPKPEATPTESPWFQWAWIGAVAASVTVMAVISRNSSQDNPAGRSMKITKNIPGTGDGNVVGQKRASTPTTGKAILGGEKDRFGDLDTSRAVRKTTPSSTDVAPSAPRSTQPRDNDGTGAPGPASTAIRRANYYSGPTRLQQNFAPTARHPVTRNTSPVDEAKAPETVLQNFQLERAGRDVLVVDQDGSIYRGKVRVLEEADLADRELQADKKNKENVEKGKAALGKDPVLQARPRGWATNGFWFQVIGTNRTLRQRVVFEGNVLNELTMKPKLSAEPSAVNVPVKAEKQLAGSKKIEALPRLRIQGRAQVGRLQYGVDVSSALSPRPAKAAPAKLDEDRSLPKK